MLFQYTWELVIEGRKTETRRIVKPNDRKAKPPYERAGSYRLGQVVPVMPSRGVKGIRKVADIRITRIGREDARDISPADAQAEGATSPADFLATWCGIHDKAGFRLICEANGEPETHEGFVRALEANPNLMQRLRERPDNLYDSWVISFDVEQIDVDAVVTARKLLENAG